jgi:hypothetical protein
VLNGQVCAKARAHSFTTGTDPLEEPAPIIQGKVWAPAEPCHTLPLYGRGPRVHESTRALGPWGPGAGCQQRQQASPVEWAEVQQHPL